MVDGDQEATIYHKLLSDGPLRSFVLAATSPSELSFWRKSGRYMKWACERFSVGWAMILALRLVTEPTSKDRSNVIWKYLLYSKAKLSPNSHYMICQKDLLLSIVTYPNLLSGFIQNSIQFPITWFIGAKCSRIERKIFLCLFASFSLLSSCANVCVVFFNLWNKHVFYIHRPIADLYKTFY